MRRALLGVAALSLVIASGALAADAPTPEAFRLRHLQLEVRIDYPNESLAGSAVYELENWTQRPASHVSLLLNRLMTASAVRDGAGRPLPYSQDVVRFRDIPMRQVTQVLVRLPKPLPPGGRVKVRVDYEGNLTGYAEIGWLYVRDHIDTSFTILRSEALAFPSIGGLSDEANRKVPSKDFTYDVSVRVPSRYLVATGGRSTRTQHDDGTVTWRYQSGLPSPFLNVSIAPFDTLSQGNVHVFYFPADSAGARRLMVGAQSALDTFAQWFGPLHVRPELCITEIPDGWGSQANAVGGIIQTAAAFRDVGGLGELYHEISHLWNAPDADLQPPRWNEGLAMFLQHLLQERLDGWSGRAAAESSLIVRLKKRVAADSSLRNVPFADYGKRDMTGASYSVGDILFATLYDAVGESDFHRMVGGYYQQYPKGGTTRDFVAFAERASSRDASALFEDWMFSTRWTQVLGTAGSVKNLAGHYRGQ